MFGKQNKKTIKRKIAKEIIEPEAEEVEEEAVEEELEFEEELEKAKEKNKQTQEPALQVPVFLTEADINGLIYNNNLMLQKLLTYVESGEKEGAK